VIYPAYTSFFEQSAVSGIQLEVQKHDGAWCTARVTQILVPEVQISYIQMPGLCAAVCAALSQPVSNDLCV
jgi:hypothetical protein